MDFRSNEKKDNSITIVSLYHSDDTRKLCETKFREMKEMNPGTNFTYVLVNNSCGRSADSKVEGIITEMGVAKGEEKKFIDLFKNAPKYKQPTFFGYQQGTQCNEIVKRIKTRFFFFVDPDLVIVRQNWISDVTEYMDKKHLLFFGTPYEPSRYTKFRNFPCQQCFFIDMRHPDFNADKVDFLPLILEETSFRRVVYFFFKFVPRRLKERLLIKTSYDPAVRIYREYFRRKELYGVTNPVFKSRPNFLDKFFSDNWSFTPKEKYYVENSFVEAGFPGGYYEKGWEEHFWRDVPFCYHIKRRKDHVGHYEETLKSNKKIIYARKYY